MATRKAQKPTKKSAPKAKKPSAPVKTRKTTAAVKPSARKTASPKETATKKSAPAAPAMKTPARPRAAVPGARQDLLQQIKVQLLKQKDQLLSGAETALNALPGQTLFPDLGDQASAELDRDFVLRLKGREQRLIKKIEDAIERIDSGIFGICEDCGNEIDVKRLFARPVTTMCIECKTLQEEEERRREA